MSATLISSGKSNMLEAFSTLEEVPSCQRLCLKLTCVKRRVLVVSFVVSKTRLRISWPKSCYKKYDFVVLVPALDINILVIAPTTKVKSLSPASNALNNS